MPTAIYDRFDAVVPFPFTDKAAKKCRPALVLSTPIQFNRVVEHSVMAMITSADNAPWPLDAPIADLREAGFSSASVSVIRMKLFTLDSSLRHPQSRAID